ncbi:MAG TPA: choice-of-anchor Q domain-containing protein [Solirubrobacterales bacterium]
MRLAIGLAVSLALLLGATAAQAEQRYAAPDGTGSTCTQQEPCSLAEASNGASNGDEVIVAAGDYTISGAPLNVVHTGLQLHGDFGGPMPRVFATLGGLPAINLSGEGVGLSYLEVQNEETEGVGVRCSSTGSRLERISATGIGEGAAGAVVSPGCIVRDSLLQGRGINSLGLESLGTGGSTGSTVTNVTAIASGGNSAGIQSRYSAMSAGTHTLTLANSIAEGASDLRTEETGGTGRIVVSNSNFDSAIAETEGAISGSANQTAPPLFVNAASGDYRPAPGSPTIDAGAPGELGALDLAGNPRVLGSAPDIGAYEFVPPPLPPSGMLTSLAVSPKSFKPRKRGGAIVSAAKRRRAKAGSTVRYSLTAATTVSFTVQRALKGRRVGGKCRKQRPGNRKKRRCTRFRALKRGFAHQGAAGRNSFRFSGRVRGKALRPGRYRLVGRAGDSVRRAAFRIVK